MQFCYEIQQSFYRALNFLSKRRENRCLSKDFSLKNEIKCQTDTSKKKHEKCVWERRRDRIERGKWKEATPMGRSNVPNGTAAQRE